MKPTSAFYALIDPSSGGFSASRCGLMLMNIVGAAVATYLAIMGNGVSSAVILTGIAGTDAGVYYKSTQKDYHVDPQSSADTP